MTLPGLLAPATAVLAGAVLLAAAVPAGAAFHAGTSADTGTLAAATLTGPSAVAATASTCEGGLLGLPLLSSRPVIAVSWTREAALATSTSTLRGQALDVVVAGTPRAAVTRSAVTADSTSADVLGYVDADGTQVALQTRTTYGLQVTTRWGAWRSPAVGTTTTTGSCL